MNNTIVPTKPTAPRFMRTGTVASVVPALLVALMPKCALCYSAYFAFFSAVGLGAIPNHPMFIPVMIGLMVLNLALQFFAARRGGSVVPFWMSLAGVALIIISKQFDSVDYLGVVGLITLTAASILQLYLSRSVRRKRTS